MAGSMILNVTYGIEVKSAADSHVQVAEQSMEAVAEAINPNSFMIDILPFRTSSNLEYVIR
jgi:hypothetical protein